MSTTTTTATAKGHIGLVVLASIGFGLALGLALVLGVFAGGEESRIVGGALFGLGAGFALLATASSRFTSQPQPWALAPGMATTLAGVGVLVLKPGEHLLGVAGWVWPVLLAFLVWSSLRGARRSLDDWSRRALVYPALAVLLLV